jgi:cytoskeleton-associated protein 5
MADDEAAVLEAAAKLPIPERVQHAHWKARAQAYEHVRDSCARAFSEDDPCFAEYGECCFGALETGGGRCSFRTPAAGMVGARARPGARVVGDQTRAVVRRRPPLLRSPRHHLLSPPPSHPRPIATIPLTTTTSPSTPPPSQPFPKTTTAPLFAKAAADGNAAALDRALEALVAFLGKAPPALIESQVAPRTCAALASKCLAARPATAARALEALLLMAEAGAGASASAALVEHGFAHKVPKASAAALDAATQLLRAFGPKHVPLQPMLKAVAPAFDARDAGVRGKAKALVAEAGRWAGRELVKAALFDKMRDAAKEEVERMLAEAGAGTERPKAERLTRAERKQKEAAEAAAAAAGGGGGGDPAAAAAPGLATTNNTTTNDDNNDEPGVDGYEFAEPRDLSPELRKDFWEALASPKWSDRRDALTKLRQLASYPRLDPSADCLPDLSRELRKAVTKDANAAVVAEAARCCAALASGLRASYSGTARALCPLLLDKLKDKSAAVSGAAGEALAAFHLRGCFSLPDVGEECAAALTHANPKVREGALAWLAACMAREPKGAVSKLGAAGVLAAAGKCADDGSPAIREAALGFLAAAARRAGTLSALEKATAKMDESKKKRLEEMVAGGGGGGGGAAAPAAAPAAPPPLRRPAVAAASAAGPSDDGGGGSSSSAPSFVRPGSRPAAVRAGMPSRAGASAAAAAAPRAPAAAASSSTAAAADTAADDAQLLQTSLTRDQALETLAQLLPGGEAAVAALTDPVWKARLEAMEQELLPKAHALAADDSPASAADGARLVQALAHVPGWDADKNFQVLQRAFEAARALASSPAFGRREAAVVVSGAADKLPDAKLRLAAADALFAAAEAAGPRFVAAALHRRGAAHKNPKAYAEALTWVAAAFEGFGAQAMDVPAALGWAKAGLGAATPAVKTAAVALLGTMHAFLGPALADMVRPDVKPALMTTLEAEFERRPKGDYAQPFKYTVRAAGGGGKVAAAAGGRGGATAGPGAASTTTAAQNQSAAAAADDDNDNLLPRADVSAQLADPALLSALCSSDWKERKAAVEAVDAAVAGAGGRIAPAGLAELAPVLRQRFADTNRNLAAQALQALGRVARAAGRAGARDLRPALAPALRCLADAKPQVRAAVVEALDGWGAPEAAADELAEALAAPKIATEGMVAGLGWLSQKLGGGGGGAASLLSSSSGGSSGGNSSSSGCGPIGSVATCIGLGASFKTGQVREAAASLAAALVAAAGARAAADAAGKGPGDKAVKAAAQEAVAKAAAAGAGGGGDGAAAAPAAPAHAAAPVPAPLTSRTSRPTTAAAPVHAPAGDLSGGSSAAAAAPSSSGPEPVFAVVDTRKAERARKSRFRGVRYDPRPDEAQALEAELAPLLAPEMRALFFACEFRRHCAAADALRELLSSSASSAAAADSSSCPPMDPATLAALDLVLRWAVLRLAEGNTSTLLSVTAMLRALLASLERSGGRLSEHEARCLLPGLVEKVGQPQERLRQELRELLRSCAMVHPPARVLAFAREGLDSKNNRTRVACAEEIGLLIAREGPRLYAPCASSSSSGGGAAPPTTPGGALGGAHQQNQNQQQAQAGGGVGVVAVLARLTSERDGDARQAALGALEQVHRIEGAAGVWRHLSGARLTDQQRSLVEERLRSSERELAKKGLVPGYRAAEFGLAPPAEVVAQQGGGGAGRGGSSGGGLAAATAATAAAAAPAAAMAATTYLPAASAAGGAGSAPAQQPLLSSMPPAAAAASSGPPLQPLARLGHDPVLLRAEWRRVLALLTDAPVEDAVDAMKLLCYEMMDSQRVAQGGAAALAMPPEQRQAVAAVGALLDSEGDALAAAVAARTDAIFAAASAAIRAGAQPNARACKYCLNALMNQFGHPSGAERVSPATLRCVVRALLLRLVDDALGRLPEGEALLRALNVLMLKVLDHCDRTACFEVLLRLLREPPAEVAALGSGGGAADPASTTSSSSSTGEARWSDLVVKCLIKLTKGLPHAVEKQQVDPPRLLLAVHEFFEALGVEEIRRRGAREDKPLRMVKTVLHELCKLEGGAIYRHTGGIPAVSSSTGGRPVIFPYIDLNLQTLQQQQHAAGGGGGGVGVLGASAVASAAAAAGGGVGFGGSASASAAASRAHSASSPGGADADAAAAAAATAAAPAAAVTPAAAEGASAPAAAAASDGGADFQAALATIFRRIAAKEDVAGALRALDALLSAHGQGPEEVEALLGGTSAAFRSFIARGLAKVRAQGAQGQAPAAAPVEGAAAYEPKRVSPDAAPTPAMAPAAPDQAPGALVAGGGGGGMLAGSSPAAAPPRALRAASGGGGGGGGGGLTPGSLQLKAMATAAAGGGAPGAGAGAGGNMDQLRDRLRQIQIGAGGGGVAAAAAAPAAAVPPAAAAATEGPPAASGDSAAVNALQARLQRLL